MKFQENFRVGVVVSVEKKSLDVASWTCLFLSLIWVLAFYLDRPLNQPIYNLRLLNGTGLASHPMWGYTLFMRLLGGVEHVVAFQSVFGAFASALLLIRLKRASERQFSHRALDLLFVAALPWWSFMAYAYQMPLSSSWMILGLLALDKAVAGSRGMALLAGVCFGIGQNLRSELVPLPGFILVTMWAAQRLRMTTIPRLRPLLICAGVALSLQLPWAVYSLHHAGQFSLSESNLGHVLFIGLGQIDPNPWNVTPSDGYAQETVNKAGIRASSLSFEGGSYLKTLFLEGVRRYPAAYLKVLLSRVWGTVCSPPFGHVDMKVSAEENEQILRIVDSIRRGVRQPASSSPPGDPGLSAGGLAHIAGGVMYRLLQGFLSRAVSVLGLVGLVLAWRKGVFRITDPLILFLAAAIVFRVAMNVVLYASGKYMTGVYLCYLPFAVNTLAWGRDALLARSGATRVSSVQRFDGTASRAIPGAESPSGQGQVGRPR